MLAVSTVLVRLERQARVACKELAQVQLQGLERLAQGLRRLVPVERMVLGQRALVQQVGQAQSALQGLQLARRTVQEWEVC